LSVPPLTNPSSPRPRTMLFLAGFGPIAIILLYQAGNQPEIRLSPVLIATLLGATFAIAAWALSFISASRTVPGQGTPRRHT
jgi:hypothetical protein